VVFQLAEPPPDAAGRFVERDVTLMANVLEAMRRTGARQLLYASSAEVYGTTCEFCTEHDLAELPESLYGSAKLAGEALVSAFAHHQPEAKAWTFRIGEVVGPRCRRGPVVDMLRAMLAGPQVVLSDDPERTRPFVHVDDCVEGILFAFDRATGPYETFNLAPGDYCSVGRIAELCASQLGKRAPRIQWRPKARVGDPRDRRLNPSKLDALGWQTTRSSEEAICDALPSMIAELMRSPDVAREPVYFAER
jgi:UDP-glucose 4-epimerase